MSRPSAPSRPSSGGAGKPTGIGNHGGASHSSSGRGVAGRPTPSRHASARPMHRGPARSMHRGGYGHYGLGRHHYHRRGWFFYRYYPHCHYYGIHGYRAAYYGSSFGGFLLSLGVIFLLFGAVISLDGYEPLFNSLFIIGLVITVLGIVLSVAMSTRMASMRTQHNEYDSENYYPNEPASSSAPSSSLDGYAGKGPSSAPAKSKGGTCPNCGAASSGDFCSFCGTRIN